MDFRVYPEGTSGKNTYLIVESIDLKLWKQIGWGFLVLHAMCLHLYPAWLHCVHMLAAFILESILIHFFSSSSDSLTVNGKANLKFVHVFLKGKCPLCSQSNSFNITKTNCSWNGLQVCTGDKGKSCTHFQPMSKWWAGKLQACQSYLVPRKNI